MPETTDTATEATETTTTEVTTPSVEDLQAEVEKWKTQSRKHEDRAKANAAAAKERDELKQSTMTDLEKERAQARADGEAEAAKRFGAKVVRAEMKAAAAGRGIDVDALAEGIDPSRFLGDDGEADTAAISEWFDRVAPITDERPAPLDLGQGARDRSQTGLGSDPLMDMLKGTLQIR